MSPTRLGVLLRKEFLQGSKSFIFIFAIVAPIVISLVLSVVFGTLFSEKARLGIADEDTSQIAALATELDSIVTREYASASALREAVEDGAVDMGIVLPQGFDDLVARGESTEITAYVWGESLAKNRAILGATVANLIRDLAGQEVPVEIVATTLGDEESIPWTDRLLPLIVLYAVIIGGSMVPATSLVDEKQKGTLKALVITPSTLEEVFAAKALMGLGLSLVMGIVILVLNQAFGSQPLLLLLVLALGSVMAAGFGILLGTLVKDITTLFAVIKAIGILLFAPAIVYLFPQIPEWVARVFPTYYVIRPVVEISQRNGAWADIAPDVFILVGLDLLLIGLVLLVTRRVKQGEV